MSFDPNPLPSKGRSRYPRWTMRDGAKVRVEDMSDKHLANAIRRMERQAQERWPQFAAECYQTAGLMPNEAFRQMEEEMEDLDGPDRWTLCLHPMHEHLTREAERRGVDVEATV